MHRFRLFLLVLLVFLGTSVPVLAFDFPPLPSYKGCAERGHERHTYYVVFEFKINPGSYQLIYFDRDNNNDFSKYNNDFLQIQYGCRQFSDGINWTGHAGTGPSYAIRDLKDKVLGFSTNHAQLNTVLSKYVDMSNIPQPEVCTECGGVNGKHASSCPFNSETGGGGIIAGVIDAIKNIADIIVNLPGRFLEGLKDLFVVLFVPREDFMEGIMDKVKDKFPILGQLEGIAIDFLSFSFGNKVPQFKISAYGVEAEIIDFSVYLPYLDTVHAIIIAIAWANFVKWLIAYIPAILKGLS